MPFLVLAVWTDLNGIDRVCVILAALSGANMGITTSGIFKKESSTSTTQPT